MSEIHQLSFAFMIFLDILSLAEWIDKKNKYSFVQAVIFLLGTAAIYGYCMHWPGKITSSVTDAMWCAGILCITCMIAQIVRGNSEQNT